MKPVVLGALLILCLGSCRRTDPSVLPYDRFLQVYADLMETRVRTRRAGLDSGATARSVDSVLVRNGVTRGQLAATVRWYGRDVSDWNGVLEDVGKELDRRRVER